MINKEIKLAVQVNDQIELLKDILSEKFGASQIFVFGSHAYGKADLESDIDLCVITDLKHKRKIEIIREIRRALLDSISSPMDILVYSEEEFKERAGLRNTLEYKIITDGLRIYG
jgi:predicted nucleotidyltransferase